MADKLEQVAIRMVEQPPLYSNEPMNNPDVAIRVMNEFLSQMDRELFCIVNLQADLTPINMNIVSGTEANYDMVDGLVNNQKKNLEKISDARNNKQTSRNQQNNKPKKRRSVIKRLHQKQIAIARRSGKPIPKYLDQEMERKRG